MFEAIEGPFEELAKKTYDKRLAKLRTQLLGLQYRILDAKRFPVIVLLNGVTFAGKSETVNLLTEWMDPRHIHAHAISRPTDEEAQRPPMYRFWRKLPPKGQIGVFFGNWYTQPIVDHVHGEIGKKAFESALDEIRRFETMLANEGALIVKYWFHLPKKDQKKRMTELAESKLTSWRVTKEDWKEFSFVDKYHRASERALARTWTDAAPWTLVDGRDERARSLFVGESLLSVMSERFEASPIDSAPSPATANGRGKKKPAMVRVDLSNKLDDDDYDRELAKWQRKLALLTRHKKFAKLSPVLVFEGVDAAGKGGAIRRVTRALDARIYQVVPIAAPSDEEKDQPYLWRFWRHAPRDGKVVIFDRSWYGRVLVERVEGFASESAWRRAYDEINDFEHQLVRAGCPVAKFWLQISPDEQLARFKEREETRWKQFKITADDWRNRDKWDAYQLAAAEMIERCSTPHAPWSVIGAEDKKYARIAVLRQVCETIERAL